MLLYECDHLYDLIKFNFMPGLRQGEILLLLSTVAGIVISTCTVRRILKCMGLYRGRNQSLSGDSIISH